MPSPISEVHIARQPRDRPVEVARHPWVDSARPAPIAKGGLLDIEGGESAGRRKSAGGNPAEPMPPIRPPTATALRYCPSMGANRPAKCRAAPDPFLAP